MGHEAWHTDSPSPPVSTTVTPKQKVDCFDAAERAVQMGTVARRTGAACWVRDQAREGRGGRGAARAERPAAAAPSLCRTMEGGRRIQRPRVPGSPPL
ncbi:hypothetical protein GN956_G24108 [Arapaima gigas]